MLLYRFCSEKEYSSFIAGETLHNISPYDDNKDSLANPRFYFFPVENMSLKDIQQNLVVLRGIVTPEILMILWTELHPKRQTRKYTTRDPRRLQELQNLLRKDPFLSKNPRYTEERTEYIVKSYSNQDFHLHQAYKIALPVTPLYDKDITSCYSRIYPKTA